MGSQTNRLGWLVGIPLVLAACADGDVAGPEADDPTAMASIVTSANLGGTWAWSNLERLRIPPFLTPMLGIVPEGDNTHATCRSTGTMSIVPTTAGFEGVASRTTNDCVTNGGQEFAQPSAVLFVRDGRTDGRRVEFSFESPTVKPCPHTAVARVEGGVVVSLRGTGHCLLPGHPQSESPIQLPPPPGGTSTTVRWEAERI